MVTKLSAPVMRCVCIADSCFPCVCWVRWLIFGVRDCTVGGYVNYLHPHELLLEPPTSITKVTTIADLQNIARHVTFTNLTLWVRVDTIY